MLKRNNSNNIYGRDVYGKSNIKRIRALGAK